MLPKLHYHFADTESLPALRSYGVGDVVQSCRAAFLCDGELALVCAGPAQGVAVASRGSLQVYREGMDREALRAAIAILQDARRPLVLFPEGVITRTNDRLGHLMEGTAFIARSAAKHRAAMQPPGQVMILRVAIRYHLSQTPPRGDSP